MAANSPGDAQPPVDRPKTNYALIAGFSAVAALLAVVIGVTSRSPIGAILASPGKEVSGVFLTAAMPDDGDRSPRPNILPKDDATHVRYPVYFGTDRLPNTPYDRVEWEKFILLLVADSFAVAASLLALLLTPRQWARRTAIACLFLSFLLALLALFDFSPKKQNVFAAEAFGDGRGELRCGVCTVSIPMEHKSGALEAPSMLRFEFREDPAKHIVLQRVDPMSESAFKKEFADRAANVAWREALVFIHGYNVSFEDAARRTAQLAHDINFGGIATFYSWPSNGHTLAYTWDEESAQWTVPHFQQFIELIAREGKLKRIHVIAHSMGNRCVLAALQNGPQFGACRFDQCVFAAPDIDRESFARQIAALAGQVTTTEIGHMTLYASRNDKALNLSQKVHRFPRAGDARPGIVLAEGLDSVDASQLETDYLGHSYFGDTNYIVNDLRKMIEERQPAAKRDRMFEMPIGQKKYWEFRP